MTTTLTTATQGTGRTAEEARANAQPSTYASEAACLRDALALVVEHWTGDLLEEEAERGADEHEVDELAEEERAEAPQEQARDLLAREVAVWRANPANEGDPAYAVYELVEDGSGVIAGVSLWATLGEAETYRRSPFCGGHTYTVDLATGAVVSGRG